MKLRLVSPTKLCLDDVSETEQLQLKKILSYRDLKAQFQLKKFKKQHWFADKFGQDAFDERVAELKSKADVCLLNETDGQLWTLSGLSTMLSEKYQVPVSVEFEVPEAKSIPWEKNPLETRTPYEYQSKSLDKLLDARHAGVELGTGLGKSFIILMLIRHMGLKTVLMAPNTNIAEQLYNELVKYLGKKRVGKYFDGTKEYKKLITVGNAQSLTRIEPGSPAWKALSDAEVFIADESHQCPAASLAKVCTGLVEAAPYRWFFSATQMRGDGLDLLLDGITGPMVFRKTVREGVDEGYLSKPVFIVMNVYSPYSETTDDPNELTRQHLFYNPVVLKAAGDIINKSVELLGHQVLVLIDEVEQFTRLLPLLNHPVKFAHGTLSDNKTKVPEKYWESDPGELVKEFNAGEFPILVGTSCISTGTDIQTVKTMVRLKGGKSEIEVKQDVGRCTRKPEGKTSCNVIDFDVQNIPTLHRHTVARVDIYNELYGPCKFVNYGGQ